MKWSYELGKMEEIVKEEIYLDDRMIFRGN